MEIPNDQFNQLVKMVGAVADFLNKLLQQPAFKIAYPTTEIYDITQGFGLNPSIYAKWGYAGHFGLDFAAPHGSPVLACDDGQVSRAGFTTGNGNFVELKHAWGSSLYMHFKDPPAIAVGQAIKKGQEIGKVGNTGYVIPAPTKERPLAGTHLHFSIKVNGIKNTPFNDFVDPTPYLSVWKSV
jgi:murein DD-endopeptidase MepM/ murein hydrolase activator NlpD